MKSVNIEFGQAKIVLSKGLYTARIAIVKDSGTFGLNCTKAEMLRFLIDSIDFMTGA